MRSLFGLTLALFGSVALGPLYAEAATITGTVSGPDGAPFRAAFVQARNNATHITVSVLSDSQGHYRVPDLAAGDYRVSIRAPGFTASSKSGLKLTADQDAAEDFALKKSYVKWSDISYFQGQRLLPDIRGKDVFFKNCVACHGFESRMAKVKRDEDGWRARVNYMRDAMGFFIAEPRRGFTDEKAEDVISFLTQAFGEDSVLPRSPADLPGYAETVHRFSDEALKIVYVEYETPGPDRMPWSAHPDKDGKFWIPYYGRANKIARLDPATGKMDEFPVPNVGTAAIHSAVPAPDGSVWLTEQGSNKLGRWDPQTHEITEFQDDWRKHTVKIGKNGLVWSTGGLSVFDPKTDKYVHIKEVPSAYGITLDKDGNVWFAELRPDGRIGKVDANTLKVTKYQQPSKAGYPRRIVSADDGTIWFALFQAGKLAQFDPKEERFKEFTLPGPKATPYAVGIDTEHQVWYSSEWMDVLGRLDPATGKVVEYPIPLAENSMRDFFRDAKGRLWFGSPANDRVGYFYLAK
jgi:streptogramin lyase/cytochrome c5